MTGTTWSVGTEPLFTAGWEEGGPLFTWPQSGHILPDGGALVGEFSEGRIYRFGPEGEVAETWGRKGEGPGEYQALDAIFVNGDSILVSDGRLHRVTILQPDGEVQTIPLRTGSALHQVSAVLPDGQFLLVPGGGYRAVDEVRPEWIFQTQPILRVSQDGATATTIVELPHLRRWYGERGGGPGPVRVEGRAGGFDGGFVWARSDEAAVRWYDSDGELLQVSRWEEEAAPLTPEWRAAMRRTYEAAFSSREEGFVAAQLARLDEGLDRYEGALPYWDKLHVDRLGNAWLSEYSLPGQASGRWRVVARDGVSKGWVDLPGVIDILDITDDRVLAVQENELDVPAVMMFELVKR